MEVVLLGRSGQRLVSELVSSSAPAPGPWGMAATQLLSRGRQQSQGPVFKDLWDTRCRLCVLQSPMSPSHQICPLWIPLQFLGELRASAMARVAGPVELVLRTARESSWSWSCCALPIPGVPGAWLLVPRAVAKQPLQASGLFMPACGLRAQ